MCKYGRLAGKKHDGHDALRVVATSPSWMAISSSFERNEGSSDVSAGVMPLRKRLVVLVKGANFQDLEQGGVLIELAS